MSCIREEEAADLEAFQRQYEDDQSWTALQEDEYGRLRPLVSTICPVTEQHQAAVSAGGRHWVGAGP